MNNGTWSAGKKQIHGIVDTELEKDPVQNATA